MSDSPCNPMESTPVETRLGQGHERSDERPDEPKDQRQDERKDERREEPKDQRQDGRQDERPEEQDERPEEQDERPEKRKDERQRHDSLLALVKPPIPIPITTTPAQQPHPPHDHYDLEAARYPLPHSTSSLRLRLHCLAALVYHQLFGLVVLANAIALVVVMIQSTSHAPLSQTLSQTIAVATAANLCAAILIRVDFVVNLLFHAAHQIAKMSPLPVRRYCLANIHYYGSVHAGCGIAGTLWWLVFIVQTSLQSIHHLSVSAAPSLETLSLALSAAALLLLCLMIASSAPPLRRRHHDVFEKLHRFGGWSAIGLFLVQSALATASKAARDGVSVGRALGRSPSAYLILITTALVLYPWLPWLTMRRVDVEVEQLSKHATRLHFNFPAKSCAAVKLALHPLHQWHPFACIPTTTTTTRPAAFSVLVSDGGDWTRNLIGNTPGRLWIRSVPVRGVLWNATMFTTPVIVATGSGIGPCLGLFQGRPQLGCRVLWAARNPRQTYGGAIVDAVARADPRAVVVDTAAAGGRPDLAGLALRLYREVGAEAVFVISNEATTRMLVRALRGWGVFVYSPIWDS